MAARPRSEEPTPQGVQKVGLVPDQAGLRISGRFRSRTLSLCHADSTGLPGSAEAYALVAGVSFPPND